MTLALLGIGIPFAFGSPALGIVLIAAAVVTGGMALRAVAAQREQDGHVLSVSPDRHEDDSTAEEEPPPPTTYNVTSHGQSGGITAGVVNISAPQPSVQVTKEAEFEPSDDGYMTRVLVKLEAPYAARNLAIFVEGTGLKASGVNRVDPSASLSTGPITYRGKSGTIVGAPLTNAYRVFVVTERPDAQINVEALLDVDP